MMTAAAGAPLRGSHWKLVRLLGEMVQAPDSPRTPHLVFAEGQSRLFGSGGCNRIAGTFSLDGDRLRLGPMASTRMACPAGMEQERRFLDSLAKVDRYRIHGNGLELLDSSGTVIAQFEAVALR